MRRFLLIIGLALACSGCTDYGNSPDYGYGSDYAYRSSYPSGYRYGYRGYANPTYSNSYPSYSYSNPSYGYSAPYQGYSTGPSFSFGFSSGGLSQ
jgi:hypothetical protein